MSFAIWLWSAVKVRKKFYVTTAHGKPQGRATNRKAEIEKALESTSRAFLQFATH